MTELLVLGLVLVLLGLAAHDFVRLRSLQKYGEGGNASKSKRDDKH